jgi:hypothetical protein
MTQKEIGQQMIIEAQEELLKALKKELRRIALKNIRLKSHLQILAGTPYCKTAARIREAATDTETFSESIINLN